MGNLRKECEHCGGHFDLDNWQLIHEPACPNHPTKLDARKNVASALNPAPVASLAAARFDRATHPEHLSPRDALVAALKWIDESPADQKPDHILVFIGRDPPEKATASAMRFFQAGSYRHHAQMGLCLEGMHRIRDSGSLD